MTEKEIQTNMRTILTGKTAIIIAHRLSTIWDIADKVVVMDQGKIKHIIDNPYFGSEDLRNNLEFYKICLQVRKWINEEA